MWKGGENLSLFLLEFKLNCKSSANDEIRHNNSSMRERFMRSFDKDCLAVLNEGCDCAVEWTTEAPTAALGPSGFTVSFITSLGTHCVFRVYPSAQLLTVDIQELREVGQTCFANPNTVSNLVNILCRTFRAEPLRTVSVIPRVTPTPTIYFSSRQDLMVYDFDRIVYDRPSAFQSVRVLHSPMFGNTLVLDDYINISEADLVYTWSIMHRDSVHYRDSTVLILGGGDGGILNEVLKEQPRFVTMIEIDEQVIECCRKHLRGVCGDSLDTYHGPHHEVIIGDCFPHLAAFGESGRKFDIVIADLTDTPLVGEEAQQREFWTLVTKVLDMSLVVLETNGCFLTHLVGLSNQKLLSEYEAMLSKRSDVQFKRSTAMVPSFCEIWAFYQIKEIENFHDCR